MSHRKADRKAVPQLSHEEAVAFLVDYQLGRLPSKLNAAVEAHLRICHICQKQGLKHATTERREIVRRMRKVRPGRQTFSRRGTVILLVLAMLVLAQVGLLRMTHGIKLPFGALLSAGQRVAAVLTPSGNPTPTPTPATLEKKLVYGAASTGTVALAISPDGKTLATSGLHGTTPAITLWNATTGKALAVLTWPGTAVPGTLVWSDDGQKLAAADDSIIAAWTVSSRTQLWSLNLPSAPALRVYDVQAATVVQKPDPATAFANGTFLLWGTNGQLTSAPPDSAGPSGVAAPNTPLVGLWQVSGSHLFPGAKGTVRVGISSADTAAHQELMSWSPDGRYLLWANTSQQVAVTPAASGTATTTSATPTSGTATSAGVSPPNALVNTAAANIAQIGHGDVLLWFAPDGQSMAECDRTASSAALTVYDVTAGRAITVLGGACDHLTEASLAWTPAGDALILALPGQAVAMYPVS